MIYGIGTDIVRIARIETALARHGEQFAERVLGQEEWPIYRQRSQQIALRGLRFLASRFAAKEAFSKAIGLGMQLPMSWRTMQVLNEASGRPVIALSGSLQQFMLDNGLAAQVSLSDEAEYALAFVLVEKTPGMAQAMT